MLTRRLIHGRPHQSKVFCLIIRANDETIAKVIDMILVLALARQKYLELPERLGGIAIAILLAVRVRRHDHQKFL